MEFKGLFFDAAGTLFELAEPVGRTYAAFAARHGLKLDAGALEAAFRSAWRATPAPLHPEGRPPLDDDRSWWRRVAFQALETAADRALEPATIESVFNDLYTHYAQASAWRLFPEVADALKKLSGRFQLHVLSNFDQRLPRILAGLEIGGLFASITLSSRAGASKPHPRIFQHALRQAGITAAHALHIGDERTADVEGATRAGLHAYHVRRPECDLARLVEKLENGDDSCLHRPANGVMKPPQN